MVITTDNIITIISVIAALCAIAAAVLNYRKANKEDGKASGTLLSDVGYIKSGVDDLKRKQEKSDERHIEIITRLSAVEISDKQAHKRIDEIGKKSGGGT